MAVSVATSLETATGHMHRGQGRQGQVKAHVQRSGYQQNLETSGGTIQDNRPLFGDNPSRNPSLKPNLNPKPKP